MTGSRWSLLALGAGLLLAVLAQYVLSYRPGKEWLGVVGYLAALALFVGGLAWPRHPQRARSEQRERRSPIAWGFLAVTAAVGMVVVAAVLANVGQPSARHYEYAGALWVGGVALAAAVLSRPRFRWRMPRGERREVIVVGLLFAVALALRLVGLARFPDVMSGDEGSMALEAQRILRGDLINPFGTGWLSHPSLFFYLEAAALRLWGWNLFGLRFTAALLGALGVPAVYLLARETFGRETPWIAAAFLAGWGLPLHFSRLALNNAADPLLGASLMAFLQRGLVRGRRGDFVVAGLALGASLYFYHGARLLIPLAIAVLALSGAARLRRRLPGLLAFAVVALLVAGPILFYFVQHPDLFMARHSVIGTFRPGALVNEQQVTGKTAPALLWERFRLAAFPFIYTRDVGYFYRPATPMLHVFSGALFVLGLGLALWRWRQVRFSALLVWVALTIVFGGWLLEDPPHYQRYLIAAPAVCLLIGRVAVIVVRRAARVWAWRPVVQRGLALLLAVALLAGNAGTYFGVYAPRGAFIWDRNTLIADRTARLMAGLGPDTTTYFFGTRYMPLNGFNSVRFLAPDADWMDILDTPVGWSFVKGGRGALFVVIPGRFGDMPSLRERFPGGREWQEKARDGFVLFTAYQLDSMQVDSREGGGETR